MNNKKLIDKLNSDKILSKDEFIKLIDTFTDGDRKYAGVIAREISQKHFGNKVFIRGLIEFSSFCKNDCYYCGLRASNKKAERYRLTKSDIMSCCDNGYNLGFRTFVLQSGEDMYFTDEILCDIIYSIKEKYSDCAITISIGERTKESYQKLFDSGADRFLLRHETANNEHYKKLHPSCMSLGNRKRCLKDLKEIGFQTGCGFMVGSPFQTSETLADDMLFIKELDPEMVGIGPFIPQKNTPFGDEKAGTKELTLFLLSLIRILKPSVNLPSTTALGTIAPNGREEGILAGANVIMPNLSPVDVRKKYLLYDNKICTGEEAAECKGCLERRMESIGYEIVVDRGDYKWSN